MKISELVNAPEWLVEARTENADVELPPRGELWWNRGEFRGGEFLGGEFLGGTFWGDRLSCNPLSVYGLRWLVVISDTKMQIGCERHLISEWAAFDDATLNKMDRGALEFWRVHGATLMSLCERRKQ